MRIGLRNKWLLGLTLFWSLSAYCFADIVLHGEQVINKPTTYDHVTLDLTDGRFSIRPGGSLTISNSTVRVQISQANPNFVQMINGNLNLQANQVNVTTTLSSNAQVKFFDFDLIRVDQGTVSINKNNFTIDKPYTIGFLSTGIQYFTKGFRITENTIDNFHGGVYLNKSSEAEISRNKFTNVSFSSIFNNGNMNTFDRNLIVFPGNLYLGDAIDIFNSNGVTVSNNLISSGANSGVSITGGNNIFIKNNKITDGKEFAIVINTPSLAALKKNTYWMQLLPKGKISFFDNNNIVISYNYLAQNKYGLKAGIVDNLVVFGNIFIQRFNDPTSRQFWTNNDNLLPEVANLAWGHNEYKEAFTQDNEGDNSLALKFVSFPRRGGVVYSD